MQLLSTIITSALVATVAGAVITEWLQSRRAKQTARFDALSAAVALEGYGAACARAIINHDLVVDSGGHAGAPLSKVPELPELPKISVIAEFLRPRKSALVNRMLILPQEALQAQQHVDLWWDVTGDPEDTSEVLAKQSAIVALEAVELAAHLRKEFRLPSRNLVFGTFDVQKTLKEKAG